jgi:ammonia channel protein AmtB
MKLTVLSGVLAGLLAVTTAFPVNEADSAVIGGAVTTPAVGDLVCGA